MNAARSRNLTSEEYKQAVSALLDRSVLVANGRKLDGRAIKDVAGQFGVTVRTIQRIWKRAKDNMDKTGIYTASPMRKGNSGRKRIYDDNELVAAMEQVPREKRGMMRTVANELGVLALTVCRKVAGMVFRVHTSTLTPILTKQNKVARYLYAMS